MVRNGAGAGRQPAPAAEANHGEGLVQIAAAGAPTTQVTNGRKGGGLQGCDLALRLQAGACSALLRGERWLFCLILLILGWVLNISVLVTIGIIVLVIGLVLLLLGGLNRPVLGRRYWF